MITLATIRIIQTDCTRPNLVHSSKSWSNSSQILLPSSETKQTPAAVAPTVVLSELVPFGSMMRFELSMDDFWGRFQFMITTFSFLLCAFKCHSMSICWTKYLTESTFRIIRIFHVRFPRISCLWNIQRIWKLEYDSTNWHWSHSGNIYSYTMFIALNIYIRALPSRCSAFLPFRKVTTLRLLKCLNQSLRNTGNRIVIPFSSPTTILDPPQLNHF